MIALLALIWDIIKTITPIAWRLIKSRKRGLLARRGAQKQKVVAAEVSQMIAIVNDPRLYVGNSSYAPLVEIRNSLWGVRHKLDKLERFALVASGEDNEDTRGAIFDTICRGESDALPLLGGLAEDLTTTDDLRRQAAEASELLRGRLAVENQERQRFRDKLQGLALRCGRGVLPLLDHMSEKHWDADEIAELMAKTAEGVGGQLADGED